MKQVKNHLSSSICSKTSNIQIAGIELEFKIESSNFEQTIFVIPLFFALIVPWIPGSTNATSNPESIKHLETKPFPPPTSSLIPFGG